MVVVQIIKPGGNGGDGCQEWSNAVAQLIPEELVEHQGEGKGVLE